MNKVKIFFCIAAALFLLGSACRGRDANSVIICTGTEDYRTERLQQLFDEQFPHYNVTLHTLPAGEHAANPGTKKNRLDADIIFGLETACLESLQDILADISSFDLSEFLPELVPDSKRFLPFEKSSGAIVINRPMLINAGLPFPYYYRDLANPVYKGLISMPHPKTSGTGYMFLASLVNAWGEDAAFAYFDSLAENILQFTASDSGLADALIQGEVAIGLGKTMTAVNAINSLGAPLDTIFFAEGVPHIITGFGILKGKENRPAVREVFEFTITVLAKNDKELFSPEPVMRNQANTVPNYPMDIPYADMEGVYDLLFKEQLLAKWQH